MNPVELCRKNRKSFLGKMLDKKKGDAYNKTKLNNT